VPLLNSCPGGHKGKKNAGGQNNKKKNGTKKKSSTGDEGSCSKHISKTPEAFGNAVLDEGTGDKAKLGGKAKDEIREKNENYRRNGGLGNWNVGSRNIGAEQR